MAMKPDLAGALVLVIVTNLVVSGGTSGKTWLRPQPRRRQFTVDRCKK